MVSKISYLSIFGLEFWKSIIVFEISDHEFVKTGVLTHSVNFGIRSTFPKYPGYAFSEGPCLGPGPLNKVFHKIQLQYSMTCNPRKRSKVNNI